MRKLLLVIFTILIVILTAYIVYYSPINKAAVIENEISQNLDKANKNIVNLSEMINNNQWNSKSLSKDLSKVSFILNETKKANNEVKRLSILSNPNKSFENINIEVATDKIDEKIALINDFENKLISLKSYIVDVKESVMLKNQADELINQVLFDLNSGYFETAKDENSEALIKYNKALKILNKLGKYNATDISNLKKAISHYIKAGMIITSAIKNQKDIKIYNSQIQKINSLISLGQKTETENDYFLNINNNKPPFEEIKSPDSWVTIIIEKDIVKMGEDLNN